MKHALRIAAKTRYCPARRSTHAEKWKKPFSRMMSRNEPRRSI
jgi:hypothetical protein